ncbi:hypothetical protein BV25DRAFT_1822024 [Artomyces pyxidatus]|uniref:Uncharacterized protein n=1 Tax=Artomyces pyxidatus TaxID=48021 RepID=A0ACB8TBP9_9AGAM|nr:hypothetical protein BV25DRAFT_1822024 [Artomyces pyxidatus]
MTESLTATTLVQSCMPSRLTSRRVLAATAAILTLLDVYVVVVLVNSALTTPSAVDSTRSELAVCGPLVLWRVVLHLISSASYLPYYLTIFVPAFGPSRRTFVLSWIALYAWVPLGLVILSAWRTCEADAPTAWDGMRREVLYTGLPALAFGALAFVVTAGTVTVTRMRARRAAPAVAQEKAGELKLGTADEKV